MNTNSLSPDLKAVWDLAEKAHPMEAVAVPDSRRIQSIREVISSPPAKVHFLRPRYAYWAVAASIVILVAFVAVNLNSPVEIDASAEAVEVTLPDNSEVLLSPNSSLTYKRRFGTNHRKMNLVGSAFFDVRSGAAPFIVETSDLIVTVEGTRFNVDVSDLSPSVSVTEGVVAVTAMGKTLRASAGESVHIEKESGAFYTAGSTEDPSPLSDMFIHIKEPLGVMFDDAASIFEMEIIASDKIRRHIHNFKHEISTPETLVSDLCRSVTSMNLRYRETTTGFQIFQE